LPGVRCISEDEGAADTHRGGQPHWIRIASQQDSYEAHGERWQAEVKLVKQFYGWRRDSKFFVPDGVYDQFKTAWGSGAEARAAWKAKFEDSRSNFLSKPNH